MGSPETIEALKHETDIFLLNCRLIYQYAVPDEDKSTFDEWLPTIVFYTPSKAGGAVLTVDEENPWLLWGHIYSPGFIPFKALQGLMMSASLFGFGWIGLKVNNQSERLARLLGFQRVGVDLYGIRL